MPSINDIVEITQELESKPVLILSEKCVAVRNRNSSCTRCIDACPAGVVDVRDNVLSIRFDGCVACQACCTACPTGALMPLQPMDADLMAQVADGMRTLEGTAVIACARISSRHEADPRTYAEVPCLCRVDESAIVDVVSEGADEVLLVDGGCRTCRYRDTRETTDIVVGGAKELLDIWGSGARVRRASAFPEACLLSERDRRRMKGESRRKFFGAARDDAKKAASVTLAQQLKLDEGKAAPTLRDMFALLGHRQTLPQFHARRQLDLMNALDRIGEPAPADEEITTRLWGKVTIDADTCTACGMCLMFCPTGALHAAPDEDARLEGCDALYEHWAAECTQCRLCEDSCLKNCLQVSDGLTPSQLIDFEPRSFRLTRRTDNGMFGAGFMSPRSRS